MVKAQSRVKIILVSQGMTFLHYFINKDFFPAENLEWERIRSLWRRCSFLSLAQNLNERATCIRIRQPLMAHIRVRFTLTTHPNLRPQPRERWVEKKSNETMTTCEEAS